MALSYCGIKLPQTTLMLFMLYLTCSLCACVSRDTGLRQHEAAAASEKKKKTKRLPGTSDTLLPAEIQQGQVLIAYSDCYTCHTIDVKAKGPAFREIARRYPANAGYIELLAQKIIIGGSGAWGYPIMTPHAQLSVEHAKLMAKYILSVH